MIESSLTDVSTFVFPGQETAVRHPNVAKGELKNIFPVEKILTDLTPTTLSRNTVQVYKIGRKRIL